MFRKDMDVIWKEASTPEEYEAVFRFRYEEYFAAHAGLPGVDSVRRRVALPHDMLSRHIMALSPDGSILAAGTLTPASEPSIAAEWKEIFHFAHIAPLLADTVIISRVVVAAAVRRSPLFVQMSLHLAETAMQSGYRCSAHYCAPRMISLYERMGYRCYGCGGPMGLSFRVPMMLSIDAADDLRRSGSPIAALLPDGGADRTLLHKLFGICPELAEMPLCLLDPPSFRRRVAALCPQMKDAAPSRLRLLRRAGVFRMQAGCTLVRPDQDEGSFLLLSGALDAGGKTIFPGSVFSSGGVLITSSENSILASLPQQTR